MVKYVSQAINKINLYEHMAVFSEFLEARAASPKTEGRHHYSELIEYLGLKMITSGSSAYYFDLTAYSNKSTMNRQFLQLI